jgi:hypothetical protein
MTRSESIGRSSKVRSPLFVFFSIIHLLTASTNRSFVRCHLVVDQPRRRKKKKEKEILVLIQLPLIMTATIARQSARNSKYVRVIFIHNRTGKRSQTLFLSCIHLFSILVDCLTLIVISLSLSLVYILTMA